MLPDQLPSHEAAFNKIQIRMKYRRLDKEELKELEQEFIQFLASNTVTADDWVKLKAENPEKAEQLIDIFSDIVFDKILANVTYLEHRQPNNLRAYYCKEDKMFMLGFLIEGESDIDLSKNESPEVMLQQMQQSGAQLKVFKGEKEYQKERGQELFELMQQGALISKDGAMFKTLNQVIQG